ncbi:MAG: thioredoxin [Synechococcales bacterium]|nr:thioredoxin [Synechococcales bacterium]
MFPFTPHTTLRLNFGLGGSFYLGQALQALEFLNRFWDEAYDRILTRCCKARIFSMSEAAQVTDATFDQEVLASDAPVLVDFWAPWCGPCRMVAPVVDEIAKDYDGRVKVVKINTDENPSVANKYGIRSIPTLMIFKGGHRVDMVVGAVPKATLSNTLEKHL